MGLCYHSFSETPAESCDLCVEIAKLREEVERLKAQAEVDVRVMGEIGKARDCVVLQLSDITSAIAVRSCGCSHLINQILSHHKASENRVEKPLSESALGPELTSMERILLEAVNEFCSCGGAGPIDGCTACKIWHRAKGKRAEKRKCHCPNYLSYVDGKCATCGLDV